MAMHPSAQQDPSRACGRRRAKPTVVDKWSVDVAADASGQHNPEGLPLKPAQRLGLTVKPKHNP